MQDTINKIKTYIGFSIKSNSIMFGQDNILKSKKKFDLIIFCCTAQEKLIRSLDCKDCKKIKLKDIKLSDLVERDNVKVVAICNYNLVKPILSFSEMFITLE